MFGGKLSPFVQGIMRRFAANHVERRGRQIPVNIRAHKDVRSEYTGQTVAYGREARDWPTP
jgi:hypothetical protein